MGVFFDTGVLVAEANEADALHHKAVELMSQLSMGLYGNWFCTSDYVFDEALTLMFIRTGRMDLSKRLAKRLLSLKSLNLLHVYADIFQESAVQYLSQNGKLSFTDCTTIELMKRNEIKFLATFDAGFNAVSEIKVIA